MSDNSQFLNLPRAATGAPDHALRLQGEDMAGDSVGAADCERPLDLGNGRGAAMLPPKLHDEVENALLPQCEHATINAYISAIRLSTPAENLLESKRERE